MLASVCSFRYIIAISAPSFANNTATALPIPESPPVITATFPASLPEPVCSLFSNSGKGLHFRF
jgi:hypothetical protein